MRTLFLTLLLASVMCAGTVNPCAQASLATYLASNTPCTIDGFLYSSFTYGADHFPNHPGPAANTIYVTPETNPLSPGLAFSSPDWTAAEGSAGDSAITYLLSTASGAAAIGSASLNLGDSVRSEPFTAVIGETLCLGVNTQPSQCPSKDLVNLQVSDTPAPGAQTPFVSFAPVSQMTILTDVFYASDSRSGSGQILAVANTYAGSPAAVPEPVTSLLGLSGLLVTCWMARKRSLTR